MGYDAMGRDGTWDVMRWDVMGNGYDAMGRDGT